jgi:hypothetical protein
MCACMPMAANTKSSEVRIQKRAASLPRRLPLDRGGCNGSLAALFWNAAAGQKQWGLAELSGASRDLAAGDVACGVWARSRNTERVDAAMFARLF